MTAGPQLYLKCEHCGDMFEHNGHKRRRWCSDKCKAAAWRAAHTVAKVDPPEKEPEQS